MTSSCFSRFVSYNEAISVSRNGVSNIFMAWLLIYLLSMTNFFIIPRVLYIFGDKDVTILPF